MMNAPRPSKRRRKPKANDADHNRRLFNMLEALEARVRFLEQTSTTGTEQRTTGSISALISALGGRIIKLEQERHTIHFLPQKQAGNWQCPADSCNRSYKRLDRYHEHIREAEGYGHAILKRIIDKQTCRQCDYPCGSANGLLHHERYTHGEDYSSRIEIIIPFFTANMQTLGEPVCHDTIPQPTRQPQSAHASEDTNSDRSSERQQRRSSVEEDKVEETLPRNNDDNNSRNGAADFDNCTGIQQALVLLTEELRGVKKGFEDEKKAREKDGEAQGERSRAHNREDLSQHPFQNTRPRRQDSANHTSIDGSYVTEDFELAIPAAVESRSDPRADPGCFPGVEFEFAMAPATLHTAEHHGEYSHGSVMDSGSNSSIDPRRHDGGYPFPFTIDPSAGVAGGSGFLVTYSPNSFEHFPFTIDP
ncbi:hypothetical protein DM02DRAFT_636699 [Periconia macrospinosa]|uniref:C2H2-type domain-containing protein n=1 Tax=Periconia macrospinosa TaxID=97972 RepID=A0A2V1CZH1_9PLEO|nr:hypothetical protein DM02DRAFT_636699 [Periconia macrospinosa]